VRQSDNRLVYFSLQPKRVRQTAVWQMLSREPSKKGRALKSLPASPLADAELNLVRVGERGHQGDLRCAGFSLPSSRRPHNRRVLRFAQATTNRTR
jgi:hypothetical protein